MPAGINHLIINSPYCGAGAALAVRPRDADVLAGTGPPAGGLRDRLGRLAVVRRPRPLHPPSISSTRFARA